MRGDARARLLPLFELAQTPQFLHDLGQDRGMTGVVEEIGLDDQNGSNLAGLGAHAGTERREGISLLNRIPAEACET
jgi:hypothetical protein